MKFPVFLLLLCVSASVAKAEELVEFYYFVNQRAYLVEEIDEGLPVLDTEIDASAIDVPVERHKSWWYKGDLPLDADYARVLVDYRLKRIAQPYGEREGESRYHVSMSWEKALAEIPKSKRPQVKWVVMGWVHDGEIRAVQALQPSKNWVAQTAGGEFSIPESQKSGFAVFWHVSEGKVGEKSVSYEWDWIVDGEDPAASGEPQVKLDGHDRGAIFYAAASGRIERVRELLDTDKKLVKATDSSEYLPLRYAVEAGRTVVAELFVERKSPLSDGWGELDSLVMVAATNGHLDTVKALMPDKPKGSKGRWHCSWAASEALNQNYEDIANYLLTFNPNIDYDGTNKKSVVLNKFSTGYPEIGFSLMERYKIKPDFDVKGFTALHSIARYADPQLLEKVQAIGVDPQTESVDGTEPLDFAIGGGNVDAICWFLDRRDETVDEESLARSLAHAIQKGQYSSVECLLGYGYDANLVLGNGLSPMTLAVVRREFEIAKLLFENGATFERDGPYSALVLARIIESDEVGLLRDLVSDGFDWNERVFGQLSIRSAAEAVEARKVLDYLNENGIDAGKSGEVRTLASVAEKPKLVTPIEVDYPDELRARYGSRTEPVEMVVSAQGAPLFVLPQNEELPSELFAVIESAIAKLRFLPAADDGAPVAVSLRTRLPLKADFELAEVFNMTDVDEKPRGLRMSTPLYPYAMQRARIEGRVVVEFTLMSNGTVRDAKPIKSTHVAFENPAVACVVSSAWEPAKRNGQPVACRVRIPIDFAP